METTNPTKQETYEQNNLMENLQLWFSYYIDIIVRGLIALGIGLSFAIFFRLAIPKLPNWAFLPILFLVSIIISPLLSKIRVGKNIMEKYTNLLNNLYKPEKDKI